MELEMIDFLSPKPGRGSLHPASSVRRLLCRYRQLWGQEEKINPRHQGIFLDLGVVVGQPDWVPAVW